jgi:hypothetical protein
MANPQKMKMKAILLQELAHVLKLEAANLFLLK